MKIQQRRPFFQAATSNGDRLAKSAPSWKRCFRPCGWIAAILSAALLIGCTSLTPERVSVLSQIAGQAVQFGTSQWLTKHPEHRKSFEAIVLALSGLVKAGNYNEAAWTELLSSLPVNALEGPNGAFYVSEGLVVYDKELKKAVAVREKATPEVLKATYRGLRNALAPKPPLPPSRLALPPGVEGRASEGDGRSDLVIATSGNVALGILGTITPTNQLHVTVTPPGPTRVSGLSVASTFDVTLNEHGIQQVHVRWDASRPTTQTTYIVQRSEDANTAWEGWASVTNAGVWSSLWPAVAPVGYWRVVRR